MSVQSVGPGDSGMYSCVPPGSHPATVHVHVQKGKNENRLTIWLLLFILTIYIQKISLFIPLNCC